MELHDESCLVPPLFFSLGIGGCEWCAGLGHRLDRVNPPELPSLGRLLEPIGHRDIEWLLGPGLGQSPGAFPLHQRHTLTPAAGGVRPLGIAKAGLGSIESN